MTDVTTVKHNPRSYRPACHDEQVKERVRPVEDPAVLTELEHLVPRWLTLAEAAQALGCAPSQVRRMLQDRDLVGVRRGKPVQVHIPAAFLEPDLLPGLSGTLTVLLDAGFSEAEAVRWLFVEQEGLAQNAVAELRAGHKTEIRRRAQILAF